MSYPEIPPAERPPWVADLKLYTTWLPRWIQGDDPTYLKTWQISTWVIRFGFEDGIDFDFDDFVLDCENLLDGNLKITVFEVEALGDADLYWKGVLTWTNLKARVGQSITVSGIPALSLVEHRESIGLVEEDQTPTEVAGYWILGVWVRKVRAKHDMILSSDHNNVTEVLKRAIALIKAKAEA